MGGRDQLGQAAGIVRNEWPTSPESAGRENNPKTEVGYQMHHGYLRQYFGEGGLRNGGYKVHFGRGLGILHSLASMLQFQSTARHH